MVKVETTVTSASHVVDYSAYGFSTVATVIPVVIRNITNNTQASFATVKSFTNTQAIIVVAESNTSGVLIGGTTEGLELVTGVNVHLIIIGI